MNQQSIASESSLLSPPQRGHTGHMPVHRVLVVEDKAMPAEDSIGAVVEAAIAHGLQHDTLTLPLTESDLDREAPLATIGTILVVDDTETNRELLARRLRRDGHTVVTVRDGSQALDILAERDFDVVMLDVMMPGIRGDEVLRHIKADQALRHIPVIMLSAVEDLDMVAHCIEIGAEDFLSKPFETVLLRARIGACLEKKLLRDRERAVFEQLHLEQAKSEALLHNTLPHQIVKRLMAGERTIADSHAVATVLFADIVGFTAFASKTAPAELVKRLNQIFSGFDRLARYYGLEKIKTIGDAYMVAGGLPTARTDHAEAIAEMALSMQRGIKRFSERIGVDLSIRIGINTGPVVAGVIGTEKFSYDVWGDTVNVASRMESHGEPGSIQVAPTTYALLRDSYEFESRGIMQIKGKGEMNTYLLHGRAEA